MNFLKLRGIKFIIGTGIFISLNYINEKRIELKFINPGIIGHKLGRKKIRL